MLDSIIKTYTTRTACSLTLALALTGGLIFARETAAREEPARSEEHTSELQSHA